MDPDAQEGCSPADELNEPALPPLAERAAAAVARLPAWLLGYRDVPVRSRLSFRIDFQSQLLWAMMMAMAGTTITKLIASDLMRGPDSLQAVLQAGAAAGSVSSFLWAWLAGGRSTIRFILIPSTLCGLMCVAVALVPVSHPYVFTLLIVGMYLAFSGVVTIRSAVWHLNYHKAGVGNIVSRLQICGMVAGAGVAGLAGWVIAPEARFRDWLPVGPEAGYRILFGVTGVLGIVAGVLCQRDRANDEVSAERSRVSLLAGLNILRHDRAYRQFLGFMMIFGFGTMMSDTPLVLFMQRQFASNASQVIFYLVIVPFVVQLVTMPFAGRLLDRTNPMRLRIWGASAWATGRACLLAAAMWHSIPLVLVSQVLSGLGGGLGAVAWQLGHMHFARKDLVAHYMGLHVTATGLRGLVAPFLAMLLWSGGSVGPLHVPAIGAWIFLIAMVMQMAGGAGFWWMDRRYRTLSPLGPEVEV